MRLTQQARSGRQLMATLVHPNPLPSRPASEEQRRWTVLLSACCGVFVSFASIVVYTFSVFLKPLSGEFGWSRTAVSFAFTLAALTVALCSPFIGRLLDRFPARRIVIPCTVIYAATFGSLSLLTAHLAHLYLTFTLLGVVGNGTAQLGYARVVSAWFDKERGRALAAVMAGSGLGSMVFPPLAQSLISHVGWRGAYATLGAIILVAAVPMAYLFLHAPRGWMPPVAEHSRVGRTVLSFPFLAICGALLLFSFATNGLNTHWAALLTDGGLSPSRAASVLAIAGFAALAGKLGTGYLLDRFRAGRAVSVILIGGVAGFAIILSGRGFGLAAVSAVLVGFGMGAESDVVPYLLTRYFGLARFSELYGYTWCVYAVAGATGPLVMGSVFDRTGSYAAVLKVSLALVAGAAALFASLPRYEPE